MIICITGFPGAGKTEVAKAITQNRYALYELSTGIFEMMQKAKIEKNPENIKRFATMLRRKYGNNIAARLLFRKIRVRGNQKIVVSGIRSKAELDYVRRKARTVTIAVVAPLKLRFYRIKKRGRASDPQTLSRFLRTRERESKIWGIGGAIKDADYVISNTSSTAELRRNVKLVLSQIK